MMYLCFYFYDSISLKCHYFFLILKNYILLKMIFPKVATSVEQACTLTHIAVTVESVRELRNTFKTKYLLKQTEKGELKKQRGRKKKEPSILFCPDAEMDIPYTLKEYSSEINAYFSE